jgi:hypothetical protein
MSNATATIDLTARDAFTPPTDGLEREHAELLRDVCRRCGPVLAFLSVGGWPDAELRTLTRFLRSDVIRQMDSEERLLFAVVGDGSGAALRADHERLTELTNQLESAVDVLCSRRELRRLVDDLLTTLSAHLRREEAALAQSVPAGYVPSTFELASARLDLPARSTEAAIVIHFDLLPPESAIRTTFARLRELTAGECAIVESAYSLPLNEIWAWVRSYDPSGFDISLGEAGAHRLQLKVRRLRRTG